MTIKYADRVLETSTTQGTGTLNLGGAQDGFQTFVAGVGTGAQVAYFIEDGTNWESGRGTVTAGSPDTLSRDAIVASSNSGLAVNWGAGTRNVFLGASSYFLLWRDENLNDTNQMATASGGTGNAHTVTLTPAPIALSDRMIVRWRAPADNTGAITVNINGLGAKNYVNNDLAAFASGKVKSGSIQEAIYNLAQDRFERTTMLFGPDASGIAYAGDLGSMNTEDAIDAVNAAAISLASTKVAKTGETSAINLTGSPSVTVPTPTAGDTTSKAASMANFAQGANGSSLVLIGSATASASTSVIFNNLPQVYDELLLVLDHVVPVVTGNLVMTFSTNNGASYLTTGNYYSNFVVSPFGSGSASASNASSIFLADAGSTGGGANGEVRIFGVDKTIIHSTTSHIHAFDGTGYKTSFGGATNNSSSAAINAIGIYFTSGNISYGKFDLYGLRRS